MFKVEIKTGGAAFRDEDGELDPYGYEVRKSMKMIIECLRDGAHSGSIIDTNGNKVGEWSYE